MQKLVTRFRVTLIVTLVLMSFLIIGVVHFPMHQELEKETANNFRLEARLNMQILEQYIDLCLLGAESLASRSAIRDMAVEYHDGRVSWEEMQEFIQPRYMDGLSAMRYIVGAARIIDGKVAVSFGEPGLTKSEYINVPQEERFVLIHESQTMNLKVYMPIYAEGEIIGFDVVLFDATVALNKVEDSPYQFSVLSDKEVKLLSGEVILLGFAEGKIYSNDDNTFYIQEFTSGEQYYYMTIPNQILYQDVDNLSIRITIATILVILLSVLFSNWYIMKKAQVVLKDSEESRSRYKEYAIKDTLTGAYSRRYLEKVREEWEIESAAGVLQAVVVVMDIDGFKGLNDQYGHEVGDEALRYLVRVILGNIRNNDILIRHGGDEFILIFKDCFQSKALEIMSRIKDYLELHDGFAHPIRISYGISEITNIENYDEVMRETDQKMYNDKRLKKAGRDDQPADEVTIKREHDDTEQKNDQG